MSLIFGDSAKLKSIKINLSHKTPETGFENICLSSGSTKGFLHLGALQYLFQTKLVQPQHVKCIIGTSVGAIIAFLLSIGFRPTELYTRLLFLDLNRFNTLDMHLFLEKMGFNNGKQIKHFIKQMMHEKRISPDITFQQHYEKTGIEFVAVASNITKQRAEYFSYKTHPDLKVLTALSASYHIPIYFTVKKIKQDFYVDGALYDNFPINYFDHTEQNKTIGINIFNKQPTPHKQQFDVAHFITYIIILLITNQYNHNYNNTTSNHTNIIVLHNTSSTSDEMFDTSLQPSIKRSMFHSGWTMTKDWCTTKKVQIHNFPAQTNSE